MKKEALIPVQFQLCCMWHDIPVDPVLYEACKLAFEFANKEGLAGRKVGRLKFHPSSQSSDPLSKKSYLSYTYLQPESEYIKHQKKFMKTVKNRLVDQPKKRRRGE
jgi:hypothetical protein